MNRTVLLTGLFLSVSIISNAMEDAKTIALHVEVAALEGDENIITEKMCPTLYHLIQELVRETHVEMPRYITLYNAEYYFAFTNGNSNNGSYNSTSTMHKAYKPVTSYTNILGDMYICRQLVASLSYDELKGIIAIAIAEKMTNRQTKMASVAAIVAACTAWWWYGVYKTYGNKLFPPADRSRYANTETGEFGYNVENVITILSNAQVFGGLGIMASVITAALAGNQVHNYTQKKVDLTAANVVGEKAVVSGIEGIEKVKESLYQENAFIRLLKATHIKPVIDFFTYPVRAYTPEERVAYIAQTGA